MYHPLSILFKSCVNGQAGNTFDLYTFTTNFTAPVKRDGQKFTQVLSKCTVKPSNPTPV